MTYLLINAGFLIVVAVVGIIAHLRRTPGQRRRAWWSQGVALVILLALTAIFDSFIIGAGIVAYDDSLISGIRIALAPVEDFAYTLAVVVMAPALWDLTEERQT